MGCGNWAGQTPQQAGHYVTVLHPDFRQMFLSPPLCSLPWLSSWLVVLCLQISSLPIKMWDLEEKVHFDLHSTSITRKTTSFLLLGWSWASGIIPEHFVPRTDLLVSCCNLSCDSPLSHPRQTWKEECVFFIQLLLDLWSKLTKLSKTCLIWNNYLSDQKTKDANIFFLLVTICV